MQHVQNDPSKIEVGLMSQEHIKHVAYGQNHTWLYTNVKWLLELAPNNQELDKPTK